MTKPNGAIIYRGPSMIDGAPIVAIVTGLAKGSKNAKTGTMLQTWILREDIAPHDAIKTGEDASICGACPHRGKHDGERWTTTRTCYVQVHNAPLSVWRAYHAGRYADWTDAEYSGGLAAGRRVRIGSYGDPAAVPVKVWQGLVAESTGWTGYTHQWRELSRYALQLHVWQSLVMASADNAAEREDAQARGWRTFTVTPSVETGSVDVLCPASAEGGHKTSCAACGLCMGTASKARKSVYIPVHGSGAKAFAKRAA